MLTARCFCSNVSSSTVERADACHVSPARPRWRRRSPRSLDWSELKPPGAEGGTGPALRGTHTPAPTSQRHFRHKVRFQTNFARNRTHASTEPSVHIKQPPQNQRQYV
ncbi:hypothetical protein F2P81_017243 [Scophthalmus maximus]|uniref:Uncharacterized protein n=1 Tax=Scophthalmus maximus TaxID=52904 RepID=A0A6A4SJI3_SCOMX|nr:hypothetical protein F2P81_017243 [Scophthalmus maximus]